MLASRQRKLASVRPHAAGRIAQVVAAYQSDHLAMMSLRSILVTLMLLSPAFASENTTTTSTTMDDNMTTTMTTTTGDSGGQISFGYMAAPAAAVAAVSFGHLMNA